MKSLDDLPLISIVIPSFNKIDYVDKTLSSIVEQKYPNLEVIINDGASNDGTVEVIKKYAKKYPKIISFVSKKDNGQLDAINRGLKKAKGQVLTFINADDVYKKGALLKVGKYFRDYPETMWLVGYGDIIDSAGKVVSLWVSEYKNALINLNTLGGLQMVNYITQPSTFFSQKTYQRYGPFTGTRNYVMEYELWLKLRRVNKPAIMREYLSSFRLTLDNISSTAFRKLLALDFEIAQKYTSNRLILLLHILNNWCRIGLVTLTQYASFFKK